MWASFDATPLLQCASDTNTTLTDVESVNVNERDTEEALIPFCTKPSFQVMLNAAQGSVVVLARSGRESAALTGALRVEPKPRARAVVASK